MTPATTKIAATDQLTTALINIAAQGLRTHCSDVELHGYWLSEDAAERAVAARLCVGCPVIDPCRQTAEANKETFGLFGGRDFTRPREEAA